MELLSAAEARAKSITGTNLRSVITLIEEAIEAKQLECVVGDAYLDDDTVEVLEGKGYTITSIGDGLSQLAWNE